MKVNKKNLTEAEAISFMQVSLKLLEDAHYLLGMAFFADYKLQNRADEVRARIDAQVRRVKEK